MGLDMNLQAKRYLFSFDPEEHKLSQEISKLLGLLGKDEELPEGCFDTMRATEVTVNAACWRKANAIHQWFVDNVQNGDDDCKEYYVEAEQLRQLRDTCQLVIDDPTQAQEELPPQEGFFFGGTEIDEYYLGDLKYTVEVIDALLSNEKLKGFEFYYQSSW